MSSRDTRQTRGRGAVARGSAAPGGESGGGRAGAGERERESGERERKREGLRLHAYLQRAREGEAESAS